MQGTLFYPTTVTRNL